MSSPDTLINDIAAEFLAAEDNQQPVQQLATRYPNMTLAQAYQVQRVVVSRLKERGEQQVGYKVGATSKTAQELLGMSGPGFGHLFEAQQVADGGEIARSEMINPVVECEITFRLKQGLSGPGVTAADVVAATDVAASLEIPDFRTHDWKTGPLELGCYNALAARFVLGSQWVAAADVDLPAVAVTSRKNGQQIATGNGSAALGNPAEVVAWLANTLAEHGEALQAGQIVMSGTLVPPEAADVGDKFEVTFEGLGPVSASFV